MTTATKDVAAARPAASPQARNWRRFKRYVRKNREIIMIVATLAMSLAFLGFGFWVALNLESLHPSWFPKGY